MVGNGLYPMHLSSSGSNYSILPHGRCWPGFLVEPAPEVGVQVRATTIEESEPITVQPEYIELEVLKSSSAKTYMCQCAITDKSSRQYQYIHNSGEITIDERGFLRDKDGFYGVALGSYFGEIGSRYIFTLDTGIEIPVVKVEEKADKHTIDGFYHKTDGSVIEFVVETQAEYMKENVHANGYIFSGNFNNNPEFKGKIQKIKKIGGDNE